MNFQRFESITGHEATSARIGTMVSAQAACDCGSVCVVFVTTAKSQSEALKQLHVAIYRHHCQTVFERQLGKCSRCGQRLQLEPHHKVRRSKGRDDRLTNLEFLCHRDHERETNPVRRADTKESA